MKRGVSQETIDPLYLVFNLSSARHVTTDTGQSERNSTSQSSGGINKRDTGETALTHYGKTSDILNERA